MWFAKPALERSKADELAYVFHRIELELPPPGQLAGSGQEDRIVVYGNGYHLCEQDHYATRYRFELEEDEEGELRVSKWATEHVVTWAAER